MRKALPEIKESIEALQLMLRPHSNNLPIERLWQYIKEQIALENFETLDELIERIEEIILTLDKETVKSLTSYDYFITAVQNIEKSNLLF